MRNDSIASLLMKSFVSATFLPEVSVLLLPRRHPTRKLECIRLKFAEKRVLVLILMSLNFQADSLAAALSSTLDDVG